MGLRPDGVSRSTIGTANARVLPDPVRDLARMSRPAIASRSTNDWIAKVSFIPRIRSASTTGADTPNSVNGRVAIAEAARAVGADRCAARGC